MLPYATSDAVVWKSPKQSSALLFLKFIDFSQGSTFKCFFSILELMDEKSGDTVVMSGVCLAHRAVAIP